MSSASEAIARDDPALPRPMRIASVRRELGDTFSIDLVPIDGVPQPAFQPGQFNMLYAFGVGEVAARGHTLPAAPSRVFGDSPQMDPSLGLHPGPTQRDSAARQIPSKPKNPCND